MWTARSTARVVTTSLHSKTPFLLYLIHFIYVINIWHLPCRAITSTLPCHLISYKNSSLTTHYCRIIVDKSVLYCRLLYIQYNSPSSYSHSRCTRLRWLSVDDVTMTCHRYATCYFSMLRVSAPNCSHVILYCVLVRTISTFKTIFNVSRIQEHEISVVSWHVKDTCCKTPTLSGCVF